MIHPNVAEHLLSYSKERGIGYHVTHEKYPKENRRRHTQQRMEDPVVLANAVMMLLARMMIPHPQPPWTTLKVIPNISIGLIGLPFMRFNQFQTGQL